MFFKIISIALLVVYVQAQAKTSQNKRLTSTPGLGNYRTSSRTSSPNQKRQAEYLPPSPTIVESYQAPSTYSLGEPSINLGDYSSTLESIATQNAAPQSSGSSFVSYTQGGSSSESSYKQESLNVANYGSSINLGDYSSNLGSIATQKAAPQSSGTSYVSYTQGGSSSGSSGSESSYNQGSSGVSSGSSYIAYTSSRNAGSSAQAESYDKEPKAYPKYTFKYGVEDKHTGDIKAQEETRDGDNVKGYYTLHQPDGTILVVRYTVDKKSGFNAVVEKQGHASHPQYSSKN